MSKKNAAGKMVQHLHHLHYPETLNKNNKRFPCYDCPIGWSDPVVSGEHKINILAF